MAMLEGAPSALFTSIDPEGPLEAAFLIRRTGSVVASWTRTSAASEVLSVMAATMLGSIETMSESLGCPSPDHVSVETDTCRMIAMKAGGSGLLVLIAQRSVGRGVLQRMARRIALETLRVRVQDREVPPPPPSAAGMAPPARRTYKS